MKIKLQYILILFLVFMQLSCSSARRLEKSSSQISYNALGLQYNRKDNVALYEEAASWLSVRHCYAGISKKGVDCSGLVHAIYKKVYAISLERNSAKIFKENCRKISKHSLREGDLVFFNTGGGRKSRTKINHVGIYLKHDKFLHSTTSKGVIVSDLKDDFYKKTWVCGGRVLSN